MDQRRHEPQVLQAQPGLEQKPKQQPQAFPKENRRQIAPEQRLDDDVPKPRNTFEKEFLEWKATKTAV